MNTGEKKLGARLQEERKKKNWSQEELAEKAGVSYSTVVKIENGINFGRRSTHQKLANTLGISVSQLVYGNERPEEDRSKMLYLLENDPNLSAASKRAIRRIIEEEYEERRREAAVTVQKSKSLIKKPDDGIQLA